MMSIEIETIPSNDDSESHREVRREDEDLPTEKLVSEERREYEFSEDIKWNNSSEDHNAKCVSFNKLFCLNTKKRCCCGLSILSKNSEKAQEVNVEEGVIKFGLYGQTVKKYVRIVGDTNMSGMIELLMNVFELDMPTLLISVTGSAKNVHMSKRFQDTLRHGLIKTLLITGAWIVSGGTNTGVMKHVGDAVKACMITGKEVVSIGIAPPECLVNKKDRIDEEPKKDILDPNHSHFVIVDTAELVEKNAIFNSRTDAESVPKILLVLAGDSDTLETIHQAIENNTPIIVVKNSGGVADILAYAYLNAEEMEIEETDPAGKKHNKICRYLEESVKQTVADMIKEEFGENDTVMQRKCACVIDYELISVYDMEGPGSVKDIDIFQVLTKGNTYQVKDQLKLALCWNRIDVARSVIINNGNKLPTKELYQVMISAILQNRVDFVKLFIHNGMDLRTDLTDQEIQRLYKTVRVRGNHGVSVIHDVIPDTYEIGYEFIRIDKNVQFLFIWSILMMYQDMAKLCWAEGKDAIAMALVGNKMFKSMLSETRDKERIKEIQACIKEWTCLANGVLSELYSTDERKTEDLLVQRQINWGNESCMSIAVQADNTDFITQAACQSLLNRIWNGRLAKDNSRWRLLLCLLCPFLAHNLLDFTERHVSSEKNNTSEDWTTKKLSVVFGRAYYFFNAPVIIFLNNLCSYLVFLSLYTYILVFSFDTQVSLEEIILIVWVFAFATEEVRQMVSTSSKPLATKCHSYINNTWNKVDTMTIVVFIIGIILRFLPYESTFEAARVVLALNYVTFFLRLLHIFSVHKELGPKLVMIGKMVQDLMYFVLILIVFVFSFAISSNSILYPNSPFTWNTAVQIIRKSYWNIYGELFLEEIEGEADCTNDAALWMNGTQARCPTDTGMWLVPIMMGIYMMIANVLLLNLLIAMFSNTFRKVQDNTDNHWYIQRYSLINEYSMRPSLFPPFNLLLPFVWLFDWLFRLIFKSRYMAKKLKINCFCRWLGNQKELKQWEEVIAANFNHKREVKDLRSPENKLNDTHDIIEQIHEQLVLKIHPGLESRLTSIENQLERIIQMNEKKPSDQAPGPV
ncbi:transient receptor potential cation channel subfamily M member-like 2 isoform X2 [Mya arenaria]|uniref:transient receptor potential cation channel subfamily M member-like 2 isoform X2 n=1 Tax=Mya arenaria TaxID=6604 RepID=UPI0022DEA7F3|nr:transient receptor potential cation channel subfamily M member-like 2 isoform X2 [Mya arenaria]